MNNTEINLKIAEAKGYTNPPHGGIMALTDYINDPALNRELEDELLEAEWCLYKDGEMFMWEKVYPDKETVVEWFEDKHRGTATALAWIEEFGDE